ncbi:MAG: type IV toxin-antitoxin system AbiEi family antitoxin domain-containing protein [Planctomycetota bacterium]|jgi:predicted transcriptional regulator of viral defense system
MAKTRIAIAKADIVKLFNEHSQHIFDFSDIQRILDKNRTFWRLAKSMSYSEFVNYLVEKTKLKKEIFNFSYRPIVRYVWGDVPLYELLLRLKPSSYFTHYTSVYFHDLTEQRPNTIYINVEQERKIRPKGYLVQEKIEAAFKRPTRLSNNLTEYQGRTIRMLNGMHTGNLGVIEMTGPDDETLRITDVERTLIDITVRPEYAGGVFEVLKAFRLAKNKVSTNKLAAILKKINYIYPYHQAIGFYLEKAGVYNKSQLDLMQKFEIKYDFYLMHQMKETEYSNKWRLYFPKGFS